MIKFIINDNIRDLYVNVFTNIAITIVSRESAPTLALPSPSRKGSKIGML